MILRMILPMNDHVAFHVGARRIMLRVHCAALAVERGGANGCHWMYSHCGTRKEYYKENQIHWSS